MIFAPVFLVCTHAIVRKPSILVFKSGLLFGFFLNSFLSSSHRTLTRAIALALTFTMTVFGSLTFGAGSVFIWHIHHLLSAGECMIIKLMHIGTANLRPIMEEMGRLDSSINNKSLGQKDGIAVKVEMMA